MPRANPLTPVSPARARPPASFSACRKPYWVACRVPTTATAYVTGTGAAVGALLLVRGVITTRGKLSPEELDPKPVFPLLRERGIEVRERATTARALG